jgi:hypothetical protein
MGHVPLDQRHERRKARFRVSPAGKLYDDSQGIFSYAGLKLCGILSVLRHRGQGMKELLRTNDAVLLSFVGALLEEADIGFMIADSNMSVVGGSIGALPRRVLIGDDEIAQARRILTEADLGHVIVSEDKA